MNLKKFFLLCSPNRQVATAPRPHPRSPPSKHHPKAKNEGSPVPMSIGQKCHPIRTPGNENPEPPQGPRKCNPVLSFFKSTVAYHLALN